MEKPKVLQTCLSQSWGGLEMVAYENAISLTKNNFECHTLCIEGSHLEKHLNAQGLPTLGLPARRRFFDFLKVRRFIQELDIKVILVQALKDLRLLSLALINRNDVSIFAISHTFVNVNKKDLVHRWSYAKLKTLICLTDLHKKNLLQYLPLQEEQLKIIPNFVDCDRFNPAHYSEDIRRSLGARPDVPLLGMASRLDPQKGQDTALEALYLLKQKNIFLQMAIVGENTLHEMNYLEVLRQRTQELGLEDRVFFTGYRADIEKILASLDVLVMPSHCETFGRVLIEAMASKTAVIATNAGGVPNIIDDHQTGLLIPPKDPQALAHAMESISYDPTLRQNLVENAYRKVETTYDKKVVENRFLDIIGS